MNRYYIRLTKNFNVDSITKSPMKDILSDDDNKIFKSDYKSSPYYITITAETEDSAYEILRRKIREYQNI